MFSASSRASQAGDLRWIVYCATDCTLLCEKVLPTYMPSRLRVSAFKVAQNPPCLALIVQLPSIRRGSRYV
ncbi:hypothetical protein J6590_016480 [Homalodisca vitripennis]|nr:hypothetical protein J6590_016480 [Homalodisca vitripennis]